MLTRAWVTLLVLSGLSTALAAVLPFLDGGAGRVAVLAILVTAWAKARVIVMRYLGLAAVPVAGRAFQAGLAGFMVAAGALYLAG